MDNPVIQRLIDERILHIIKRGYSSKSEPGVQFHVLQIDYGCYVQLLRTNSAPEGLFGSSQEDGVLLALFGDGEDAEVPEDDYRAIRRAVLDLPAQLLKLL
jgi:hypothetical protein